MIKMQKFKRCIYWLISCTWGIVDTTLGALCFLFTCPFTKKRIYKGAVISYIGHNWGGFNLGPFAFEYVEAMSTLNENRRLTEHEWGHSIQNLVFGPLQLFLVDIPSAIRYWYRRIAVALHWKKSSDLPPYDSIWFEHSATQIGYNHRDDNYKW